MTGPTTAGAQSATTVLELVGAWRTHGQGPTAVTALRDVSLTLREGELVAVMGPSGSGKSTLLNLSGGLDQPTQGDVRIGPDSTVGASAAHLAMVRRRHLGFVFQDANLVGSLTAGENVALPRELDGVPVRVARREARSALAEVGLAGVDARFPADLSGGQQQRVAIARALVGGRRLILADEPTGALDTTAGDEILRIIRARCDAGAAALVVTHNARHAAWADRVLFLRDGEVVEHTSFAETPADAPHPDAARLPLAGLGARQGTAPA
jgi:putative ABC transport system ATP-binding protein